MDIYADPWRTKEGEDARQLIRADGRLPYKVYGPKRSGTNYVTWLLDNAFAARGVQWHPTRGWISCSGHKHGLPVLFEGIDHYVFTIKNFYAWYLSFRAFSQGQAHPIVDSIAHWEMYAQIVLNWMDRTDVRTILIRHEDVIRDEDRVIARASEFLSLTPVTPHPSVPFARRQVYLDETYLDAWTPGMRAQVDGMMSGSLLNRLGYSPHAPWRIEGAHPGRY